METVRNNSGGHTTSELISELGKPTLYPAICWLLTSKLGVKVAACTSTRDITLSAHPGVVFKSASGIVPTLIDAEEGGGSTGLQVLSVFSDEITEEQIDAGDWNSAAFEIFLINRKVPEMGELIFFSGQIGQVDVEGGNFTAEARPLSSLTARQFGRVVTHKCGVRQFADKNAANQCKLDPADFTTTGVAVTTGGSQTIFIATGLSGLSGGHTYTNGVVTWTTGPNMGRQSEVKSWDNSTKQIELHIEMAELIGVGDTFSIIEGCDRTPGVCHDVFNNMVNIRSYHQVTNIEDINVIDRAQ